MRDQVRPWWKKKRWAAAFVGTWLVIAYPFAAGELMYANGYGSVPSEIARPLTLFGLWSPEGTGLAARYQAHLTNRAIAGEVDQTLDDAIAAQEFNKAHTTDSAAARRIERLIEKAGAKRTR